MNIHGNHECHDDFGTPIVDTQLFFNKCENSLTLSQKALALQLQTNLTLFLLKELYLNLLR